MKGFLLLILALGAGHAFAASAAVPPAAEIEHLLDYLSDSNCEFQRNGRWHDSGDARAHLQRKLQHARKRQPGLTAEQFIEHVASGSSLSGKPYQVRCAGAPTVTGAAWFRAELQRRRAGR
jgi:hypothetical protein